ncbi:hypothetical protein BC832DRAFT_616892 [Gaertneriomyces semiglobifer]|nr:hypothetical protein BC832DRAFT_616892 [Gaertneriomyces semiglobifer]
MLELRYAFCAHWSSSTGITRCEPTFAGTQLALPGETPPITTKCPHDRRKKGQELALITESLNTKFLNVLFGNASQLENRQKKVSVANQFHGAMEEVDSCSGGAVNGEVKRFLDLGCAPGGFSRWILEHNPDSIGMGVTLPPEMGRIPMVMEGILEDPSRYHCEYRDVTDSPVSIRWYLHPDANHETIDPSKESPPPLRKHSRQLLAYSQLWRHYRICNKEELWLWFAI